MECSLCGFVSQSRAEHRRHAKSARCLQARTILFCCKQCKFTAHSLVDIRAHICPQLHYEHNEVERLRAEANMSGSYVMTTAAELEWYKMNVNLNVLRHALKNDSLVLDDVGHKSVLAKCKERNVPIVTVLALMEQKRRCGAWLNDDAPGLPLPQEDKKRRSSTNSGESTLCTKSIAQINIHQWQHLFFDFTIHRRCDVDHYFKLLFAKADANYWPFCLTHDRLLDLCFRSSPIIRRGHQQFFVGKTKQPLQNAILELDYKDWTWVPITRDDLYRYIHQEWILQHFNNIVVILEKTPGFLANDVTLEQIEEKFGHLVEFVRFWSNPDSVLEAVGEVYYVDFADDSRVECTLVETEFEDVIKARSKSRNATAWKLILERLKGEKSPSPNC